MLTLYDATEEPFSPKWFLIKNLKHLKDFVVLQQIQIIKIKKEMPLQRNFDCYF